MKHRITFTFKPVVIEVESFSGVDVAEERARNMLRAQIAEGSLPIWCADWSQCSIVTSISTVNNPTAKAGGL